MLDKFFSEMQGDGKAAASLTQLAKDAGADIQEFVACMANYCSVVRINRDLALPQKPGINSAPAIVVVDTVPDHHCLSQALYRHWRYMSSLKR